MVGETPEAAQASLEDHTPFPRPTTPANRIAAAAVRLLPVRPITPADVARWRDDSLHVCSALSFDEHVLERVGKNTIWLVSDAEPPDDDIWSGEVIFKEGVAPAAICYSRTLASRLPRPLLELAWQGAMDHFVGHLYPYHQGAASPGEYDEAAACRHQHMAACLRGSADWRFRLIARVLPWVYRAHKGIPLSNYTGRAG